MSRRRCVSQYSSEQILFTDNEQHRDLQLAKVQAVRNCRIFSHKWNIYTVLAHTKTLGSWQRRDRKNIRERGNRRLLENIVSWTYRGTHMNSQLLKQHVQKLCKPKSDNLNMQRVAGYIILPSHYCQLLGEGKRVYSMRVDPVR